jgi:hypothetical protein
MEEKEGQEFSPSVSCDERSREILGDTDRLYTDICFPFLLLENGKMKWKTLSLPAEAPQTAEQCLDHIRRYFRQILEEEDLQALLDEYGNMLFVCQLVRKLRARMATGECLLLIYLVKVIEITRESRRGSETTFQRDLSQRWPARRSTSVSLVEFWLTLSCCIYRMIYSDYV